MKRKDFLIIAAVLLLAGALLLLGRLQGRLDVKVARPSLRVTNAESLQSGDEKLADAESYLRIKQGEQYYHLVPLLGLGEIVIRQDQGYENVIHIDKNSVVMHSANCPNQDCVRMGEMTLQNIETRTHQRWITCLAHQLSLELMPREDALRLVGENAK